MVVRTIQSIPLVSVAEPTSNLLHQQSSTVVHIESENIGTGTLYVAESSLQWINSTSGLGFAIEYPRITIHAISRDTSHFPEECIYLQVDKEKTEEDGAGGDMTVDNDEDDEDNVIEIRLVPQDKTSLEDIFMAMNQAQKMHPDPDQSPLSDDFSGDDDDEDQFQDADDHEGNGNGNLVNGIHGSSEDESMDLDHGDR